MRWNWNSTITSCRGTGSEKRYKQGQKMPTTEVTECSAQKGRWHGKGARDIWPNIVKYAAIPTGGREYTTLTLLVRISISKQPRRLAAGTGGDVGGGCTKQGVPTHDQDAGLGRAVQRSSVGRQADHHYGEDVGTFCWHLQVTAKNVYMFFSCIIVSKCWPWGMAALQSGHTAVKLE